MSDEKGDLIHLDKLRQQKAKEPDNGNTTPVTFTRQQNEGFQLGVIYGVLKHKKPHLWGCTIGKHLVEKAQSISQDIDYKSWVKKTKDTKATVYFYDPEQYEGERK